MKQMKRSIKTAVLSLTLALMLGEIGRAEPPQLMSVDEIRPGMKGIGKTVFSGTKIEEFDVEILGVLTNQSPGGDEIMARISGGPLPLEQSGVLAGMSGSPIYIDGKLIGALAFTPTSFLKEPIVGITPIHEMLQDAERLNAPAQSASREMFAWRGGEGKGMQFAPIDTPLVVSGLDPRAFAALEKELSAWRIAPMQGGSASKAVVADADTDLQPGSAVGIQLMRGDLDFSGVGTVTYRDGDKIIAFGHPMFYAGPVDFPMTAAYVHFAVPSLYRSFKMASPLAPVGAITQDRRTGISGKIGQTPRMIPFEVTLTPPDAAAPRTFAFEVMNYKPLAALLMKIAALNAVYSSDHAEGEFAVATRTTIQLADSSPMTTESQFNGKESPIEAILGAFLPLDLLIDNEFEPVSVERVSLEMTIQHLPQAADIIGMRVNNEVARPGDALEASITVQPYNAEPLTLTETLTIPQETASGVALLFACDADVTAAIETMRAQAKYTPQDLEQLKRLLQEKVNRNTLVLSLLDLKPGAVIQGQEFPSPPLSMMSMLNSGRRFSGQNSLTRGRILARKLIGTEYVMSGCSALPIRIDGHLTETDAEEAGQMQPVQPIEPMQPKEEGEEIE